MALHRNDRHFVPELVDEEMVVSLKTPHTRTIKQLKQLDLVDQVATARKLLDQTITFREAVRWQRASAIQTMWNLGFGSNEIARGLGCSEKTIRRWGLDPGAVSGASGALSSHAHPSSLPDPSDGP